MLDATFTRPDLTTFAGVDGLGLEVTGQHLEPDRAVLACRVVEPDDWCHRCGCQGVPRDSVTKGVGARAVRVATHHTAAERAPLPLHRVRARVAPRHQRRGAAAPSSPELIGSQTRWHARAGRGLRTTATASGDSSATQERS